MLQLGTDPTLKKRSTKKIVSFLSFSFPLFHSSHFNFNLMECLYLKRVLVLQKGITLIIVPCWWDGNHGRYTLNAFIIVSIKLLLLLLLLVWQPVLAFRDLTFSTMMTSSFPSILLLIISVVSIIFLTIKI